MIHRFGGRVTHADKRADGSKGGVHCTVYFNGKTTELPTKTGAVLFMRQQLKEFVLKHSHHMFYSSDDARLVLQSIERDMCRFADSDVEMFRKYQQLYDRTRISLGLDPILMEP